MSAEWKAANVRPPVRADNTSDSTGMAVAVTTTADNTQLPAAWGLRDGAQYVEMTADGGDIAVLFLKADDANTVDITATGTGPGVGTVIKDGVTKHYLIPQGYLWVSHDGSASCTLWMHLA